MSQLIIVYILYVVQLKYAALPLESALCIVLSVCLSRAVPNRRKKDSLKSKINTKVVHVTCNSPTSLKVKGQG